MQVVVRDRRRIFDDFFRIDEAWVSVEQRDGTMGPDARRLSFERGDSASAVVYCRDRRGVLLVHQFRFPTYDKGPGWITETAAGMVDEGETPEESIRREVVEETGYEVEDLEKIGTFYLSPGGSSERIHLYCAEVSSRSRAGEGGGNAEEAEDIRVVELPLEEVERRLAAGDFVDAKTVIALQWLLARAGSR